MTLDEAIQHCYDVANKGCDECAEEHLQLAKWLEELKRHRKFRVNKDIKNPFANISGYVCYHCDHKDEYIIEYENTGLTPNQVEQMKQENAELKRLLKLAAKELTPDICDYCIYNGSKHCEEENAELECGNMACQFAYWRHYDEVKGLIKNGNELDSGV